MIRLAVYVVYAALHAQPHNALSRMRRRPAIWASMDSEADAPPTVLGKEIAIIESLRWKQQEHNGHTMVLKGRVSQLGDTISQMHKTQSEKRGGTSLDKQLRGQKSRLNQVQRSLELTRQLQVLKQEVAAREQMHQDQEVQLRAELEAQAHRELCHKGQAEELRVSLEARVNTSEAALAEMRTSGMSALQEMRCTTEAALEAAKTAGEKQALELNAARERITEVSSEMEAAVTERQAKLDAAVAEARLLENELEGMKTQNATLSHMVKEMAARLKDRSAEVQMLQAEMSRRVDKTSGEAASRELVLETKMGALKQELVEARSTIEALCTEMSDRVSTSEAALAEMRTSGMAALEAAKTEGEKKALELDAARQQLLEVNREMGSAVTERQAKLDAAVAEARLLENELEGMKTQNATLSHVIKEMAARLKDRSAEVQMLEAEMINRASQWTTWTAQAASREQVLETKVDALNKELGEARATIEALRVELSDRVQTSETTLAEMRTSGLAALDEMRCTATAALKEVKTAGEKQALELNAARERITEVSSEMEAAVTERQAKLDAAVAEARLLENELEGMKTQNATLSHMVKEMAARLKDRSAEVQMLQAEMSRRVDKTSGEAASRELVLETKMGALKQELVEARATVETMRVELSELRSQLEVERDHSAGQALTQKQQKAELKQMQEAKTMQTEKALNIMRVELTRFAALEVERDHARSERDDLKARLEETEIKADAELDHLKEDAAAEVDKIRARAQSVAAANAVAAASSARRIDHLNSVIEALEGGKLELALALETSEAALGKVRTAGEKQSEELNAARIRLEKVDAQLEAAVVEGQAKLDSAVNETKRLEVELDCIRTQNATLSLLLMETAARLKDRSAEVKVLEAEMCRRVEQTADEAANREKVLVTKMDELKKELSEAVEAAANAAAEAQAAVAAKAAHEAVAAKAAEDAAAEKAAEEEAAIKAAEDAAAAKVLEEAIAVEAAEHAAVVKAAEDAIAAQAAEEAAAARAVNEAAAARREMALKTKVEALTRELEEAGEAAEKAAVAAAAAAEVHAAEVAAAAKAAEEAVAIKAAVVAIAMKEAEEEAAAKAAAEIAVAKAEEEAAMAKAADEAVAAAAAEEEAKAKAAEGAAAAKAAEEANYQLKRRAKLNTALLREIVAAHKVISALKAHDKVQDEYPQSGYDEADEWLYDDPPVDELEQSPAVVMGDPALSAGHESRDEVLGEPDVLVAEVPLAAREGRAFRLLLRADVIRWEATRFATAILDVSDAAIIGLTQRIRRAPARWRSRADRPETGRFVAYVDEVSDAATTALAQRVHNAPARWQSRLAAQHESEDMVAPPATPPPPSPLPPPPLQPFPMATLLPEPLTKEASGLWLKQTLERQMNEKQRQMSEKQRQKDERRLKQHERRVKLTIERIEETREQLAKPRGLPPAGYNVQRRRSAPREPRPEAPGLPSKPTDVVEAAAAVRQLLSEADGLDGSAAKRTAVQDQKQNAAKGHAESGRVTEDDLYVPQM